MSGIAGLWRLDGRPVEPAELESMTARLAHRGPDGAGAWHDGPVGLGHRMLHTTPESLRERQPLVSASADLVLTADARLDNRDELCSLLSAPRSLPDPPLIRLAYERWGARCPEHLLGDFAFAIWDRRERRLFCARDHFGVKPFYYHHRPGRLFAFASEIKGLLTLPDVPRRLNETRVADYLVPLLEDKEITFYEEIVRLPPAHWMTVGREGIRRQEYWALDPEREIRLRSDDEYAAAFREIFTEAVRCRLRSAYPIGSLLSGGLDSSSIVCVARRLLAENGGGLLHTFSAVFPNVPECDEREYIEAVVAGGGVEPHYVRGDQLSPLNDLGRVLAHEDEPPYAPNLFLHWGLHTAAKQSGVRVLLDGIDGDTTVSHGVRYLTELARMGRWAILNREVRGLSKHFNDSYWTILFRFGLKPFAPEPIRRAWRAFRTRAPRSLGTTIRQEFAARIRVRQRREALLADRLTTPTTLREDHWRSLTRGLIPLVLEIVDRAAAAFTIDVRYPFFDRRLAEFCLALPGEQKLRNGWTRAVMRRAMAGVLPEEVQSRGGKSDLGHNFSRTLLAFDRGVVEESIVHDSRELQEFVDLPALRRTYYRCLSRPSEQDALTVWKAVMLGNWLPRTSITRPGGVG